jgi:hypothetical protein
MGGWHLVIYLYLLVLQAIRLVYAAPPHHCYFVAPNLELPKCVDCTYANNSIIFKFC